MHVCTVWQHKSIACFHELLASGNTWWCFVQTPVHGAHVSCVSTHCRAMSVQLAELDAEKHAGLVQSVARDISDYQAPDMPSLVEFVRDTSARLGVIMTDEAAVLAQFPTWPQVRLELSCAIRFCLLFWQCLLRIQHALQVVLGQMSQTILTGFACMHVRSQDVSLMRHWSVACQPRQAL